ncbi:hypothetical protein CLCR_02170 [Cladophialophora carrionii]|uniref:Uncharacterized protein n=1 Tax=Cladophialophora carrionii TaxID=86049 RepID=A0A1C1CDD4_9EURO|nr:hypothetical protein CLCR_02170 [Cladophialophora carrionii]
MRGNCVIQFAIEDEITGSFHHALIAQEALWSVSAVTVFRPEHAVSMLHVVGHDSIAAGAAVPFVQTTTQFGNVCEAEHVLDDADEELAEEVMLPDGVVAVVEGVGVSGG